MVNDGVGSRSIPIEGEVERQFLGWLVTIDVASIVIEPAQPIGHEESKAGIRWRAKISAVDPDRDIPRRTDGKAAFEQ
jgi:hypothetical protein